MNRLLTPQTSKDIFEDVIANVLKEMIFPPSMAERERRNLESEFNRTASQLAELEYETKFKLEEIERLKLKLVNLKNKRIKTIDK